jgi:hypothetical protein
MKERALGIHLAGAALFAGAAAWALQQQAGYIAASWVCGAGAARPIWLLTLFSLILLLAGSLLSWRAIRPLLNGGHIKGSDFWRPRRFLSLVSLMAALLFLFTVLMQAAAVLFLPGCLG